MPAVPLIDFSTIDLTQVAFDKAHIRTLNPQRFEFELLDTVSYFNAETLDAVGYHDLKEDAFWARGHIPGTPLFPGALMVEATAQLSALVFRIHYGPAKDRFFGFGGIDKVKFRGMAFPGQRLWLSCKPIVVNRRHSRFAVQGNVDGKIVLDGEIVGVNMPVSVELDSAANA